MATLVDCFDGLVLNQIVPNGLVADGVTRQGLAVLDQGGILPVPHHVQVREFLRWLHSNPHRCQEAAPQVAHWWSRFQRHENPTVQISVDAPTTPAGIARTKMPLPRDTEILWRSLYLEPHDAWVHLYQLDPGTVEEAPILQKVLSGMELQPTERPILDAYLHRLTEGANGVIQQLTAQARTLLDVLDSGMSPDKLRETYLGNHAVGRYFRERTPIVPLEPSTVFVPDETGKFMVPYLPKTLPDGDAASLLEHMADRVRFSEATGLPLNPTELRQLMTRITASMEGRELLGLKPIPMSLLLKPGHVTSARKPSYTRFEELFDAATTSVFSSNIDPEYWKQMAKFSGSVWVQVGMIPMAAALHVGTAVAMHEMSWQEASGELASIAEGSLLVLTAVAGLHEFARHTKQKEFTQVLDRYLAKIPPRVRSYAMPTILIGLITYAGWRSGQEVPTEERSAYYEHFLKEAVSGFGISVLGTMGSQWGLSMAAKELAPSLMKTSWLPFVIGGIGATIGWTMQDVLDVWVRKSQREEFKLKAFVGIIDLLSQLRTAKNKGVPPTSGTENRLKELFAQLFAVLVEENPAFKQVMEYSEAVEKERGALRAKGMRESEVLQAHLQVDGPQRTLTAAEQIEMKNLFEEIKTHPFAEGIPVSTLSATQVRLLETMKRSWDNWKEALTHPKPLPLTSPDQWGLPQAANLLFQFSQLSSGDESFSR